MEPDFDSRGMEGFIVSNEFPAGYKGPLLQGGKIIALANEQGSMTHQQLQAEGFTFSLNWYHFLQPQTILGKPEDGFLISFLALKNNIRYFIQGIGALYLKAGQFAIFRGGGKEILATVEKETQGFGISWSSDIIQQTIPFFPFLKQFVDGPLSPGSFYLGKPATEASYRTLGIIHELLHNPYDDEVSILFYENKVRDLLMSLLVDKRKKRARKQKVTREEEEKIKAIGELIARQINNKFPIATLARKAGMNEMKLKTAFKEIFGKAIFEYQLAARMEEAHRLILETDMTTKAIAMKVGYRHTTSFISKFSEYFGYPPGKIQP
jgi:AraC-like DNA-binding protein